MLRPAFFLAALLGLIPFTLAPSSFVMHVRIPAPG